MKTSRAKAIQVKLSSSECARLSAHPSYPHKEKGKHTVLGFHYEVFMEGLDSPRYRIKELEHQLKEAESRTKAAQVTSDYWMKKAKSASEGKRGSI